MHLSPTGRSCDQKLWDESPHVGWERSIGRGMSEVAEGFSHIALSPGLHHLVAQGVGSVMTRSTRVEPSPRVVAAVWILSRGHAPPPCRVGAPAQRGRRQRLGRSRCIDPELRTPDGSQGSSAPRRLHPCADPTSTAVSALDVAAQGGRWLYATSCRVERRRFTPICALFDIRAEGTGT